MRNETEFIKCSKKRYLTAKASKFLSRCIDIAVKQRGYTRYHSEMKPLKEQIKNLVTSLFIDQKLSINDIKELIKNSKNDLTKLKN